MARPKYCSWDVKELANDYGWTEILENSSDDSSVLKFYSKIHEEISVEVSLTTGYVSASMQHPSRGRTRLNCGERMTYEDLEEVFNSPRCLFSSSCGDLKDCEVSLSKGKEFSSDLKHRSSNVEVNIIHKYQYEGDMDDGLLLLDRLIKDWDSKEKTEILREISPSPMDR